jgi:hypothetical protein
MSNAFYFKSKYNNYFSISQINKTNSGVDYRNSAFTTEKIREKIYK